MRTPKMTRSHFQFIAATLKQNRPDSTMLAERDQWDSTVNEFAKQLRITNPRFRVSTFFEACGVEVEF